MLYVMIHHPRCTPLSKTLDLPLLLGRPWALAAVGMGSKGQLVLGAAQAMRSD